MRPERSPRSSATTAPPTRSRSPPCAPPWRRARAAGGPAAARNAGLARVDTELVAFLDSDCVTTAGWPELLCGVLADPRVGAAGPRIRPLPRPARAGATAASPLPARRSISARYLARVQPGGRVAYVSTAALVARTEALGDGFDPALRYGEDVDLVWRILDAGWIVRYEPAAVVGHAEPERFASLARRRFAYGSAAGPLALRHPQRLAPLRVHPRPMAAIALAAVGRPGLAAGAAADHVALTVRTLRRAHVPATTASALASGASATARPRSVAP